MTYIDRSCDTFTSIGSLLHGLLAWSGGDSYLSAFPCFAKMATTSSAATSDALGAIFKSLRDRSPEVRLQAAIELQYYVSAMVSPQIDPLNAL
jgi:hypothetical protein